MNVRELRPATAEERKDIIIPGLISLKKHKKTMTHQHTLTLIAGILIVTVVLFVCFFPLRMRVGKCLLFAIPFIALFSISAFRSERTLDMLEHMVSEIVSGAFLVKEIRTKYEGTSVLVVYVKHPMTARYALQAFAGANLDESTDPTGEIREELERVCRTQRRGSIVELEFPAEGGFFR